MWVVLLLLLAVFAIFAGLAASGASISLVLCVGFALLIASIWISQEIYTYWLADQLNIVLARLDAIRQEIEKPTQIVESPGRVNDLERRLGELHGAVVNRLDSLNEMVEFAGSKIAPNFKATARAYTEAEAWKAKSRRATERPHEEGGEEGRWVSCPMCGARVELSAEFTTSCHVCGYKIN